jgi:hypothetical protein
MKNIFKILSSFIKNYFITKSDALMEIDKQENTLKILSIIMINCVENAVYFFFPFFWVGGKSITQRKPMYDLDVS